MFLGSTVRAFSFVVFSVEGYEQRLLDWIHCVGGWRARSSKPDDSVCHSSRYSDRVQHPRQSGGECLFAPVQSFCRDRLSVGPLQHHILLFPHLFSTSSRRSTIQHLAGRSTKGLGVCTSHSNCLFFRELTHRHQIVLECHTGMGRASYSPVSRKTQHGIACR